MNGFQYYKATSAAVAALKYILTAEGYVSVTTSGTTNSYNYVFTYKDHLGNVRVSYGFGPTSTNPNLATYILQESNYYPFGLQHSNYNMNKLTYDDNIANGIGGTIVIPPLNYQMNKYKYNGKEMQDELGLNEYAFEWRDYDPAIGRWNVIDQLSEKYISTSPYAFVQNNPLINREIDGRYFDKKNEKKAARLERKAEKQANKLEKKADKLAAKGQSTGDLRDRVTELRNSAQDVRDMRSDTSTEYKYGNVGSKEAKSLGLGGPSTLLTGQNTKGDNVITMFTEKNVGNQLHETRHGGQNARNEFNIAIGANYGVADEVSAYRAQYSWSGNLTFLDVNKNPTPAQIMSSIQSGVNPLQNTILNINSITPNFVNSQVDSGFVPIYPPASIQPTIWNSN